VRLRIPIAACVAFLGGCPGGRDRGHAHPAASMEKPAALSNAVLAPELKPPERPEDVPAPAALPARPYSLVLHTGDSTVGGRHGLARAVRSRFEAEGTRYIGDTVNRASLLTGTFVRHVARAVDKHHPDLVLINLGTNEVFVPAPDALAGRVRALVRAVGPRDCVWIGPPTWRGDTGIVRVIRENAAPCRFFDSSGLHLDRRRDGIHPTDRGGEQWASLLFAGDGVLPGVPTQGDPARGRGLFP
jgi:acyl-CoA thioesterase-1